MSDGDANAGDNSAHGSVAAFTRDISTRSGTVHSSIPEDWVPAQEPPLLSGATDASVHGNGGGPGSLMANNSIHKSASFSRLKGVTMTHSQSGLRLVKGMDVEGLDDDNSEATPGSRSRSLRGGVAYTNSIDSSADVKAQQS